jgi:hypothetical protein
MSISKAVVGIILLALVGTSCGGGDAEAGGGSSEFRISAPSDGDAVTVPFKMEFSTDAQLGPPESGENHVHVFYDGNEDAYEVVNGDSFVVSELDAGKHTLSASLRNADHSPAGAEDTITVTIRGDGGAGDEGNGSQGDGGYGY